MDSSTLLHAIDSGHDIILFSLDTEYRLTYFTQAYHSILKIAWNIDILSGDYILDLIPQEYRKKSKAYFDRALRLGILHHPR